MEVIEGSARFGLWYVVVSWSGSTVYHVHFSRTPVAGPVPRPVMQYLAGKKIDLTTLTCGAAPPGPQYGRIYRNVQQIPYGETATYGEIAERAGTHARVVGQALARNLLPLIIPCHRVVSRSGMGGFTPDPTIKEELLALERRGSVRSRKTEGPGDTS